MVQPEWRDDSKLEWERHRATLEWVKVMESRGSPVAVPAMQMDIPLPNTGGQPYKIMTKTINGVYRIILVEHTDED